MHKITYQFIAIVLAVVLGFSAGYYYATKSVKVDSHKTENTKLLFQVDSLRNVMKQKDQIITVQDSLSKVDSVQIVKILERIKHNDAALEQERKRVNNLPTNEKVNWLYHYYNIK